MFFWYLIWFLTLFLSPNLFFFFHLIWGVPWLWGSELLLMCCTPFNSQLSKGKTPAEDRKCSTATAGNSHRKISKCPFSVRAQVFLSQTAITQRDGLCVLKSISQKWPQINLMPFLPKLWEFSSFQIDVGLLRERVTKSTKLSTYFFYIFAN